MPYAEEVKDIATLRQLKTKILELLHLVEEASHFIIGYKSDRRAGKYNSVCRHNCFSLSTVQTLKMAVGSTAQEQIDDMIKKLKKLKEEFDRGVGVQTLQVADAACE